MFNIIKLTAAPKDFISSRYSLTLLDPMIIDREEEWKVERILDSRY